VGRGTLQKRFGGDERGGAGEKEKRSFGGCSFGKSCRAGHQERELGAPLLVGGGPPQPKTHTEKKREKGKGVGRHERNPRI